MPCLTLYPVPLFSDGVVRYVVSLGALADTGPIPPELANIPQLTDLDLAENLVEGMHMHMHSYPSLDARCDNAQVPK